MKSPTPLVQSYLFFGGRCEEALEFYRTVLGAEITMMMRFKEAPEPPPPGSVPDGSDEKIMHAAFVLGDSTIMASDGCGENAAFAGFSLSLTYPDEAVARSVFAALEEGGSVCMPLGKTFWSPLFGIVEDRFGVSWMISLPE